MKELEDFAEKVAAKLFARNQAKVEANAKQDSQTSQRSEDTAVEHLPKGTHNEGKSSLLSRLAAVEAVMATTPTQQVTQYPLATGVQMPVHMGWMSPYHALMH